MIRLTMPLALAVALVATPALSQDGPDDTPVEVITGSRIVRQDFEAMSPVTTVGPEDPYYDPERLELTPSAPGWKRRTGSGSRLWRADAEGASSVRVIHACEISLRLNNDPCA